MTECVCVCTYSDGLLSDSMAATRSVICGIGLFPHFSGMSNKIYMAQLTFGRRCTQSGAKVTEWLFILGYFAVFLLHKLYSSEIDAKRKVH